MVFMDEENLQRSIIVFVMRESWHWNYCQRKVVSHQS